MPKQENTLHNNICIARRCFRLRYDEADSWYWPVVAEVAYPSERYDDTSCQNKDSLKCSEKSATNELETKDFGTHNDALRGCGKEKDG